MRKKSEVDKSLDRIVRRWYWEELKYSRFGRFCRSLGHTVYAITTIALLIAACGILGFLAVIGFREVFSI